MAASVSPDPLAVIVVYNSMNRFKSFIFWASIFWILISLILINVGNWMPFDFVNENVEDQFYSIAWVTFPLAVLLTLLRTTTNSFGNRKALIIALTIAAATTSFVLLAFDFLGYAMCGYHTQVVFKNKSDWNTKVIEKRRDCGATTGTSDPEFYKTKSLFWPIVYSKKVDTSKLNPTEWHFVHSEDYNYR